MSWTEADFAALKARRRKPAGAKAKMQALGRLKPGRQNKTELSYEQHLEWRRHMGEVLWFKFEAMKFRLADNTHYTPDYMVLLADGTLEAHEVKGFWTDDARVKIKVAAELYPVKFVAVRAVAKKDGGGWAIEEF